MERLMKLMMLLTKKQMKTIQMGPKFQVIHTGFEKLLTLNRNKIVLDNVMNSEVDNDKIIIILKLRIMKKSTSHK